MSYAACVDCGRRKKRPTPHPRCADCAPTHRAIHELRDSCMECGRLKRRPSPSMRCQACETRRRMREEDWQPPKSQGNKRPLRVSGWVSCVDCGKRRRGNIGSRCMGCEAVRRTGQGNPAFRTGITDMKMRWRWAVLERDGYQCTRCGTRERLHAHHIRPRKERPDLEFAVENGRTLCHACHNSLEPRRLGTGDCPPGKRSRVPAELRRV